MVIGLSFRWSVWSFLFNLRYTVTEQLQTVKEKVHFFSIFSTPYNVLIFLLFLKYKGRGAELFDGSAPIFS